MLPTNDSGPGLRISIAELARIKGITRQSAHERLTRLVGEGRIEVRRGKGGTKLVSLAEWDAVTNEVTDPARLAARDTAREIAGTPRSEPGPRIESADPTYTDELRRKAGFEADLKQIELRKQRGELLDTDDVRRAMERCAEALVREIGTLGQRADDIAAACGQRGVAGVRELLRTAERDMRTALARAMTLLAGDDAEAEDEEAA